MARTRKRYTEQERARILAAAEREGLSGPKAAKKFGISTLTFYNWRKRAGSQATAHASGVLQADSSLALVLRAEVRARVAAMLPGIVQEEVVAFLGRAFSPKQRT